MAIAFVQSRSVAGSLSLAYTNPITSGNLLIVVAANTNAVSAFTISDTIGNVWNALSTIDNGAATGSARIFWAIAKASGADTVNTTDSNGAGATEILLHEFSGISSIDVQHSANGTGNSQDSGAATTLVSNELLFGVTLNILASGLTLNAGAGWTQAEKLSQSLFVSDGTVTEYQIVAATGTYNATSTTTVGKGGSDHWLAEIVTFSGIPATPTTYQMGCRQHRTFVSPGMNP